MRQGDRLVEAGSQSLPLMERALTEMNVPLAHVISDLCGESGLRLIAAILEGEREGDNLAPLKERRLRASPPP